MWPFLKPLAQQEGLPNKTYQSFCFICNHSPYTPPKKCFKAEATEGTVSSNNQITKKKFLQEYDHFHQHSHEQSQKKVNTEL